jgi:hypothetical protein
MFVLLIAGLFYTDFLLKKEYDKLDKNDLYWTYAKVNVEPFRHLKLEGGNLTNIAFEPAPSASVRINRTWDGFAESLVKVVVKNDTAFVKFPETGFSEGQKEFLSRITPVRIFAPELLSIDGNNTQIGLFKMKQKNYTINLSGKSKFEVESYIHALDSVNITGSDSAFLVFEISPDSLGTDANISAASIYPKGGPVALSIGHNGIQSRSVGLAGDIHSWEAMTIASVNARLDGLSLLDIGHAQIGSLNLNIADTSGVILSGQALRLYNK